MAAHFYCADCHTLFRDTDRESITTADHLLLAPNPQAHLPHDSSLVMNADTHYYACPVCGENHEEEAVHTFASGNAGSVICTVCGYTEPSDGMPEPPVSLEGETETIDTAPPVTEPIASSPSLPANLILFAALAVLLVAVLVILAVILAVQLLRKRSADDNSSNESEAS